MIKQTKWFTAAIMFVLLAVLLVSCAAPAPTPIPAPSPMPEPSALQSTVDAIRALKRGLDFPEHLQQKDAVKTGEEFDINQYFTVLTHLSMQSGYVLDYVYLYDGMGGQPIIYARKVDQAPYLTYSEYVNSEGKILPRESLTRTMDKIQVDGTADGFFEFIAFYTLGNQLYLYWHAMYNDAIIICDHTGLEATLTALDNWDSPLPPYAKQAARALDFRPIVELEDNTAIVKIVIFTKWGGFIQESYTISRDFPHRILERESKTLVDYLIGIVF